MGSYMLVLYVTTRQEKAIQGLFSKHGWKFRKAEFNEPASPSVKPEESSDDDDNATVDIDQTGDAREPSNHAGADTTDQAGTATCNMNKHSKSDQRYRDTSGLDTMTKDADGDSDGESKQFGTSFDDEDDDDNGDNDDIDNDNDNLLPNGVKVEPPDEAVTETGNMVKPVDTESPPGTLYNTRRSSTAVAVSRTRSTTQKRKRTSPSGKNVSPKVQRKSPKSSPSTSKSQPKRKAVSDETEAIKPDPEAEKSGGLADDMLGYTLEQVSDIDSDGEGVEDTKTTGMGNSGNERVSQKPPPVDIDDDSYSESLGGYFCRDCGNAFDLKTQYSSHKHGNNCVFTCKHCEKQFSGKQYQKYITHERGHTGPDDVPQTSTGSKRVGQGGSCLCNICGAAIQHASNLRRHIQSVHLGVRFPCPQCSKDFQDVYMMREHIAIVHQNAKMLCEFCSKIFTSRRNLRQHIHQCHESENKYWCPHCQKNCSGRRHFEGHMNSHRGIKPNICQKCGKTFGYLTSLHKHQWTCTGTNFDPDTSQSARLEKCKCKVCGKQMKSQETLHDHMEGAHGEKNKTCVCGKSFSWRPSYHRHAKKCKFVNKPDPSKIFV